MNHRDTGLHGASPWLFPAVAEPEGVLLLDDTMTLRTIIAQSKRKIK